jgi:hypothetical protein
MNDAKPQANFPKQAVIIIHGMGEQMPMDTIKGFVRAIWETDADVTQNGMPDPAEVWSKPDDRTGSLELRRLTTRPSRPSTAFPNGARVDFYELYWADLSGGSTWDQVQTWIFGLLLRNPWGGVPPKVRLAWLLLWAVTLAVALLAVAAITPHTVFLWRYPPFYWLASWPKWILAVIAFLMAAVANHLLVPYIGRVVRYTRAKPDNIAARQAIRARGLALLDSLHNSDYDRIVIVGHSLGSILAYDLVSYYWAGRLASHTVKEGTAEFAALVQVEGAIEDIKRGAANAIDRFLQAQRAFARVLRLRAKPAEGAPDRRWIITDLVTLGSPLAHAEFLLASDVTDLRQRIGTREYPTSPPLQERLDPQLVTSAEAAGMPIDPSRPSLVSFKFGADNWQLHHAAPFAAVRWTNIYDPSRLVFCGDIVSGPIGPVFGTGVVDINLAELRGQSWTFTHTKYWALASDQAPGQHILKLRAALDLAGDYLD